MPASPTLGGLALELGAHRVHFKVVAVCIPGSLEEVVAEVEPEVWPAFPFKSKAQDELPGKDIFGRNGAAGIACQFAIFPFPVVIINPVSDGFGAGINELLRGYSEIDGSDVITWDFQLIGMDRTEAYLFGIEAL